MRYHIGFDGRWQGPILHALDDLGPIFDPATGHTVIVARDQAEFVTIVNRTAEVGLTVVEVTVIGVSRRRDEP